MEAAVQFGIVREKNKNKKKQHIFGMQQITNNIAGGRTLTAVGLLL
jgi:hypothetical protein